MGSQGNPSEADTAVDKAKGKPKPVKTTHSKWTDRETDRLKEIVERFGQDIGKLTEGLQGKSATQIKTKLQRTYAIAAKKTAAAGGAGAGKGTAGSLQAAANAGAAAARKQKRPASGGNGLAASGDAMAQQKRRRPSAVSMQHDDGGSFGALVHGAGCVHLTLPWLRLPRLGGGQGGGASGQRGSERVCTVGGRARGVRVCGWVWRWSVCARGVCVLVCVLVCTCVCARSEFVVWPLPYCLCALPAGGPQKNRYSEQVRRQSLSGATYSQQQMQQRSRGDSIGAGMAGQQQQQQQQQRMLQQHAGYSQQHRQHATQHAMQQHQQRSMAQHQQHSMAQHQLQLQEQQIGMSVLASSADDATELPIFA